MPADIQQPIIQIEKASLDFGGGVGVFDLDLTLREGCILGFIGPSGCGKTTTLRLLAGVYQPTHGSVRVFGQDPTRFSDEEKCRLGYMPQQFLLYHHLTVEENLHFMGGMYRLPPQVRKERITPMLEFFDLGKARNRLGKHLSGGMKRRLMLAGTLLHQPELIFADEPTAGIDPILRSRIWAYFHGLRKEGHTLLVSTQYVGEASYCDLVAVMRQGRIITVDTPRNLRRRAMGGDIIHLVVDDDSFFPLLDLIVDLPLVTQVKKVPGEKNGMHVFVEDVEQDLPQLLTVLRESLGVTPRTVEHYLPPFDDVFVRLIEQEEAACEPGSYKPILSS